MTKLTQEPSVFISYCWESERHKSWVVALADRLVNNGVRVIFDRWELKPGDQLPQFMEKGVRESDAVLVICTPTYKERSDQRLGGVGYEGHVITAEVLNLQNQRKFVPILRAEDWKTAAPSWLLGSLYIDMSDDSRFNRGFADLLVTIFDLADEESDQECQERWVRKDRPPAAEPFRCGNCRVVIDRAAKICRGCGSDVYWRSDRFEYLLHTCLGVLALTVSLQLALPLIVGTEAMEYSFTRCFVPSALAGLMFWFSLSPQKKSRFKRPDSLRR